MIGGIFILIIIEIFMARKNLHLFVIWDLLTGQISCSAESSMKRVYILGAKWIRSCYSVYPANIHTTSQQRRYNIAATSWRCSDVVTTLLWRCVFAG